MSYLQVLNCAGDIRTCCSDYGLAQLLSVVKKVMDLVHIIVPIILMVMLTIQLAKMVANPDEKKNKHTILNKFIATLIIFFLPTITNIVLSWMPSSFEVHACWNSGNETSDITRVNKTVYINQNKKKKYNILMNPDDYEKGDPKKEETPSQSTGNNTILLIAGHSFPPYCLSGPSDCRGRISSGYDETEETRNLVKLIKAELNSLNVKADIANALMAGDSNTMNRSFYLECRKSSAVCTKYNWGQYRYVLEIHFNASGGNAAGTQLVKRTSNYSTKADEDIVNAVIRNTGQRRYSDYIYGAFDIGYFMGRNVPITYLETEFYDNKRAMDIYSSKKTQIAKDIAAAIKRHYG